MTTILRLLSVQYPKKQTPTGGNIGKGVITSGWGIIEGYKVAAFEINLGRWIGFQEKKMLRVHIQVEEVG